MTQFISIAAGAKKTVISVIMGIFYFMGFIMLAD